MLVYPANGLGLPTLKCCIVICGSGRVDTCEETCVAAIQPWRAAKICGLWRSTSAINFDRGVAGPRACSSIKSPAARPMGSRSTKRCKETRRVGDILFAHISNGQSQTFQVKSVDFVPQPIEQLTRQRLFEFEVKRFPVRCDAEAVEVGICQCLNIGPAPASRVTRRVSEIVYALIAETHSPVAAAQARNMPGRYCREGCALRLRFAVSHRFFDAAGKPAPNPRWYQLPPDARR